MTLMYVFLFNPYHPTYPSYRPATYVRIYIYIYSPAERYVPNDNCLHLPGTAQRLT